MNKTDLKTFPAIFLTQFYRILKEMSPLFYQPLLKILRTASGFEKRIANCPGQCH